MTTALPLPSSKPILASVDLRLLVQSPRPRRWEFFRSPLSLTKITRSFSIHITLLLNTFSVFLIVTCVISCIAILLFSIFTWQAPSKSRKDKPLILTNQMSTQGPLFSPSLSCPKRAHRIEAFVSFSIFSLFLFSRVVNSESSTQREKREERDRAS